MNLVTLQRKFNTHLKCVKHLEKARWHGHITCPHCGGDSITSRDLPKKSKRGRPRKATTIYKTPKFHCNKCNRDFTALTGTIFAGSKLPLHQWFMIIALMLNARKGLSAKQVTRDVGVTYKTAWFASMRVRCAMADNDGLLEGIVEFDEVYLGGRPRKRNKKPADNDANLSTVKESPQEFKRGRGTKKVAVVGVVERGPEKRVRLEIMDKLSSTNLLAMLKRYVNQEKAIAVTDEFKGYAKFEEVVQHLMVKHSAKEYVRGIAHTNTIEGFWNIVKSGLKGQYHALSKKYLPFYLAEWSYKYNRLSRTSQMFDETIEKAVSDDKCLVKYKPKKDDAREITLGRKFRKKPAKKSKHKPKRKARKK